MTGETYVIRGGHVGRERLRILSRVLEPTTGALLARLPIAPDARVLDIGCGGGDVTIALARLVPAGHVVGIDLDPTKLEMARDDVARAGLTNIEFHLADAVDVELGHEHYDVAYARFLLCHLAQPELVVRRVMDALVPGGLVVVEDTDIAGAATFPASPAHERCRDLYRGTVRRRGADPDIGWRVPLLLRDAGADDIEISVVQPSGVTGEVKTIQTITLALTRDAIVAAGLATADEVDRTVAEMEAFSARPDTVVSVARIVQTWGRKPADV